MYAARTLTAALGAMLLGHAALAAEIDKKDADYLRNTAQGLMSEVRLGEMAQKQAADERVRQFGKRMVDDHGKDLQNIRQLASRKHLPLPDAPDKEQREEAGKLARLSGADFDREYVNYEMKDHAEDVEESGKAMLKAADPDVKRYADAEYRTVLAHKKEIDAIHVLLDK